MGVSYGAETQKESVAYDEKRTLKLEFPSTESRLTVDVLFAEGIQRVSVLCERVKRRGKVDFYDNGKGKTPKAHIPF